VLIESGIEGSDVLTLGPLSASDWSTSAVQTQVFDEVIDINYIPGQS